MQVIIVGCGKVGRNLAEQLQAEDTGRQGFPVAYSVVGDVAL